MGTDHSETAAQCTAEIMKELPPEAQDQLLKHMTFLRHWVGTKGRLAQTAFCLVGAEVAEQIDKEVT